MNIYKVVIQDTLKYVTYNDTFYLRKHFHAKKKKKRLQDIMSNLHVHVKSVKRHFIIIVRLLDDIKIESDLNG